MGRSISSNIRKPTEKENTTFIALEWEPSVHTSFRVGGFVWGRVVGVGCVKLCHYSLTLEDSITCDFTQLAYFPWKSFFNISNTLDYNYTLLLVQSKLHL